MARREIWPFVLAGFLILSVLIYIGNVEFRQIDFVHNTVIPVVTSSDTLKAKPPDGTAPNTTRYADITFLELETQRLVNEERMSRGIGELVWNSDLAYVARLHSKDMAVNSYFDHQDLHGTFHDERLRKQGIFYFNFSGENLAKGSIVKYYTKRGDVIIDTVYKAELELASEMVAAWMDSAAHRDNILTAQFGEAGVGIASENETYYFTQLFITRITCGYKGAACCRTPGYFPWCYIPHECKSNVCG